VLDRVRIGWAGLPAPVPVWPAARPPRRVQVFGYPLAEGPLNGVWRQFVVAGPATPGAVQLDWIGEVGTFHQVLTGHDGGVWAVAVGAAAGWHPGHRQAAATLGTARCGCGGWPAAPRSGSRWRATTLGLTAVAVGALPDGTPVIVSGGSDRTVRAWRLADGTPLAHPLDLSESGGGIAPSRQYHRHPGRAGHRCPPHGRSMAHKRLFFAQRPRSADTATG